MTSSLDGISVLDLTHGMAGAVAGMLLCDNGARVIRVEYCGSEEVRQQPAYAVWDRGKESIFLNLSNALNADETNVPKELNDFYNLVRSSDVIVETFEPSSEYQNLVDYKKLKDINPSLVHCSITAYGKKGPYRDHHAMHDLVMARTGILSGQPTFRDGPSHLIHPVPSLGAAILASQGIVAGLYAREKSGFGTKVDTSLLAGAILYSPKVQGEQLNTREIRNVTVGGGPFYSVLECADGEWLHLGCLHADFVKRAAQVMGIMDVLSKPRFADGIHIESEDVQEELLEIVAEVIKTKSCREWLQLLEKADVPCARASTTDEAMEDPQVQFNDMVVELMDHKLGDTYQMGLPIKLSKTPGEIHGSRPKPGEHTRRVLKEVSNVMDFRRDTDITLNRIDALELPLKGVKILGAANVIAGPTAARCLSGLGAEITKLEAAAGDISRVANVPYFYALNANMRCISANTRTDKGKEIAGEMAINADVLLANMRPGATDRMGLNSQKLRELNPDIIEAHITAYGWDGPYAHKPGVDPLAQAIIGLERAQGGYDNQPVMVRLAPTDYTAGALGALGVVMALFARERFGVVQKVDTNLLNAGIFISSEYFIKYDDKPPRQLTDKYHYGLSALHRVYETKTGWIYIIVETDKDWNSLCEIFDCGGIFPNVNYGSVELRMRNDKYIANFLTDIFKSNDMESLLRLFEGKKIPCAPVMDEETSVFFSDPQVISNDMVIVHQHPRIGWLKLTQNEVKFEDINPVYGRPTPLLGQHTDEVLKELGYSAVRIKELYRNNILKADVG